MLPAISQIEEDEELSGHFDEGGIEIDDEDKERGLGQCINAKRIECPSVVTSSSPQKLQKKRAKPL